LLAYGVFSHEQEGGMLLNELLTLHQVTPKDNTLRVQQCYMDAYSLAAVQKMVLQLI
jgi:hypothetical protein